MLFGRGGCMVVPVNDLHQGKAGFEPSDPYPPER